MSKFKTFTAKAVSFVAAETHFILQTATDCVAHAEGYAVSKLTDVSKRSVIEQRRTITKQAQADRIQALKNLKASITPQRGSKQVTA